MSVQGKDTVLGSLMVRRTVLKTGAGLLASASIVPWSSPPSAFAAQSVSADWPIFRGDPGRTGATAEPGPDGDLVPLWMFTSDARNPSNPVVAGQTLFVLGDDDILWALDRASGAQRWAIWLGGAYSNGFHTVPVVTNGLVVSGSATGVLFALNADTGAEQWRYQTGDLIISPPLVLGTTVYAGSNDGFVYAIESATGAFQWKTETGPIFGSAASSDGDNLFIGGGEGTFLSLDRLTGTVRWTYATGGAIKTAAVSNGLVYAPSGDGRLYALDTATGELRWASPDTGADQVNNPSVLGDIVVVTIDNHGVFAYDAATGAERWNRRDQAGAYGSPVIAGDAVYVSVLHTDLVTFELGTGETRASYPLGQFAGAPAVAGGVMYIVADDGTAYAFGAKDATGSTPVPVPTRTVGTMPSGEPLSQPPDPGVPQVGTFVRAIATASGPDDGLLAPEGIAFGADGRMFVLDALHDRIVIYDATGGFVKSFGRTGSNDGNFSFHQGDGSFLGDLVAGPDGSLYVTDSFNSRIQQFDGDGNHLKTFTAIADFIPAGIAIDSAGTHLIASDLNTGTLTSFDIDGTTVERIAPGGIPLPFATCFGLSIMDDGSLWVAEYDASDAVHVSRDGTELARLGRFGIAGGRFNGTVDLTFDADGNLFVSDYGNGRIQVFDTAGSLIGVVGSLGTGDGQFVTPTYLTIGPDGLLYVSDDTANRVQVFSISL